MHDGTGTAVENRHLEREQQHVGEFAWSGVDWGEVARRQVVPDEGAEHAVERSPRLRGRSTSRLPSSRISPASQDRRTPSR